jgi:hypothetical protein
MERPFTPASNVRFWIVLVVVATIGTATIGLPMVLARAPIATGQDQAPEQPIPFDHRHHATRDQIDCFYCHPAALTQAKADVPTVERCMGCHQQIWTGSPMLAPVIHAYQSEQPIVWTRVNQLPDFVYFDHAVHVHQGISCFTCHGRVDQMARVRQEAPLLMKWCLDCHRSPEGYLRPRDLVTATVYQPAQPTAVVGAQLASLYGTRRITHCSACHR